MAEAGSSGRLHGWQEDEARLRDRLIEVQDKVDAALRDNLDTPVAMFQLEALIRAANLYRTARDTGLRTGGESCMHAMTRTNMILLIKVSQYMACISLCLMPCSIKWRTV